MKHFTLCLFGKEVLSMAWATEDAPGEEYVRLGGDFEVADAELADEEVSVRRPIGFMS